MRIGPRFLEAVLRPLLLALRDVAAKLNRGAARDRNTDGNVVCHGESREKSDWHFYQFLIISYQAQIKLLFI